MRNLSDEVTKLIQKKIIYTNGGTFGGSNFYPNGDDKQLLDLYQ